MGKYYLLSRLDCTEPASPRNLAIVTFLSQLTFANDTPAAVSFEAGTR